MRSNAEQDVFQVVEGAGVDRPTALDEEVEEGGAVEHRIRLSEMSTEADQAQIME